MPSFSNVPMTTIVAAGAVKTIASKSTSATKPTNTTAAASNQSTSSVQAAINHVVELQYPINKCLLKLISVPVF
ncbi:hypothetical protein BC829DRAFT_446361 [Chytridium lagenaria]|nr:hypothetical protein BC829DRAFT_446361 [Chytridium lagenaria]